jgi:hypothetical protein
MSTMIFTLDLKEPLGTLPLSDHAPAEALGDEPTTLRGQLRFGYHQIGPQPQPLRRKSSSERDSAIEMAIW